MQVTMELSKANDWGGRQDDSPAPPYSKTNTHTHTPLPQKITAVASLLLLDSSGHSCGKVQLGKLNKMGKI